MSIYLSDWDIVCFINICVHIHLGHTLSWRVLSRGDMYV